MSSIEIDETIHFSDIIGHTDVKKILERRLSIYLKYKDLLPGASKGILMYGLPGVGKTMLVIAALNNIDRSKVLCKIVTSSDLTEHVSSTSKKVQNFFEVTRKEANGRDIVLLFDEADEIVPAKGEKSVIANERVSAILRELDGIEKKNKGLFIIMTTNHPARIEPAMLRSGRVDYHVKINPPTDEERLLLVKKYLGDIPGCEPHIESIARYIPQWTGADISKLRNELMHEYFIGKDKDANYKLNAKAVSEVLTLVNRFRNHNFKKFEKEYAKYSSQDDDEEKEWSINISDNDW